MQRRGFTLMEMMVVIAIIGIMAGLSIASGQYLLAVTKANSAAAAAGQVLRDARVRAMTGRCAQLVIFNPTGPMSSVPYGYAGDRGAVLGINKASCANASAADAGPGSWEFSGGTSSAPLDRTMITQDFTTFGANGVLAIGSSSFPINSTNGVAVAFDQNGQLAGAYPVGTSGTSSGAFVSATSLATLTYSRPEIAGAQRTVVILPTGSVYAGQLDGGI